MRFVSRTVVSQPDRVSTKRIRIARCIATPVSRLHLLPPSRTSRRRLYHRRELGRRAGERLGAVLIESSLVSFERTATTISFAAARSRSPAFPRRHEASHRELEAGVADRRPSAPGQRGRALGRADRERAHGGRTSHGAALRAAATGSRPGPRLPRFPPGRCRVRNVQRVGIRSPFQHLHREMGCRATPRGVIHLARLRLHQVDEPFPFSPALGVTTRNTAWFRSG